MRNSWLILAGALGLLCLPATFAACSDETSGGGTSTGTGQQATCNEDPFSCPAGQTCWVDGTASEPFFQCLNSGMGQVGEDCMNYIGQPTCADGLTCFSVPGYPNVCTPFCDPSDPAHACPNGANCLQIVLAGTDDKYFACQPEDGGGGGGGGGSGQGGSGGAGQGGAGGGQGGSGGS